MLIRNALASDTESIDALLDSVWRHDELWGPLRPAAYAVGGPATVIVVVDGDAVCGVGSLLPSSRTAFGILHLDVAPGAQRKGVGSALLADLRKRHPAIPMMMRVRPWDDLTRGFVDRHAFKIGERVIEGWVDPASPEMGHWISDTQAGLSGMVRIESFDLTHPARDEIAGVIDAWFVRHHPWAPPRNLSLPEAVGRYLVPALAGTCHHAMVKGRIVGAGVLVADPFGRSDDGAHLAYLGVGESGRKDEVPIVKGLFAACLASARVQQRLVQIEVTNLHTPAWNLVQSLPESGLREGLIIYVG